MPIKDGVIYIDNTYAKDVATCALKGYVLRVLGYQPIDRDMDAAHAGNVFHKGIQVLMETKGDSAKALEAFYDEYDRLLGPEVDEQGWAPLSELELISNPDDAPAPRESGQ